MNFLKITSFLTVLLFLNFTLIPIYLWAEGEEPSECLKLFEKTSKKAVIVEAAKNILIGAGIGAGVGNIVEKDIVEKIKSKILGNNTKDKKNKEDKEFYMILGAIIGALGGAIYTASSTKEFQLKEREKVINEVGYKPSQGTYFEVLNARLLKNEQVFRKAEFIPLLMRYRILLPDENATPQINYNFRLYFNNNLISQFYDIIPLPQGEVADYFVFPVCQKAYSGSYKLEIEVITGGKKVKRYISWEVAN